MSKNILSFMFVAILTSVLSIGCEDKKTSPPPKYYPPPMPISPPEPEKPPETGPGGEGIPIS